MKGWRDQRKGRLSERWGCLSLVDIKQENVKQKNSKNFKPQNVKPCLLADKQENRKI
jgi:hypothetical protein